VKEIIILQTIEKKKQQESKIFVLGLVVKIRIF